MERRPEVSRLRDEDGRRGKRWQAHADAHGFSSQLKHLNNFWPLVICYVKFFLLFLLLDRFPSLLTFFCLCQKQTINSQEMIKYSSKYLIWPVTSIFPKPLSQAGSKCMRIRRTDFIRYAVAKRCVAPFC